MGILPQPIAPPAQPSFAVTDQEGLALLTQRSSLSASQIFLMFP
jgi:hypothetical protein